jgi:hypothetical protein
MRNNNKTAVISQTGMGSAIGLSNRGNAFPRFLASKAMAECVSAQLREKLAQPLKFQWGSGGAQPQEKPDFRNLAIDLARGVIVYDITFEEMERAAFRVLDAAGLKR